jgi:hypothetical protein
MVPGTAAYQAVVLTLLIVERVEYVAPPSYDISNRYPLMETEFPPSSLELALDADPQVIFSLSFDVRNVSLGADIFSHGTSKKSFESVLCEEKLPSWPLLDLIPATCQLIY